MRHLLQPCSRGVGSLQLVLGPRKSDREPALQILREIERGSHVFGLVTSKLLGRCPEPATLNILRPSYEERLLRSSKRPQPSVQSGKSELTQSRRPGANAVPKPVHPQAVGSSERGGRKYAYYASMQQFGKSPASGGAYPVNVDHHLMTNPT